MISGFKKNLFVFCFFFLSVLLLPPYLHVQAADFNSEYSIEYFIKDEPTQEYTKAAYVVRLTNLQPDRIVSTFSISFPQSFGIGNIQVSDDTGTIIPQVSQKDRYNTVSMKFNNPKSGLNEVNSLYINFLQKNVFRSKGTVWEILIPTMQTENMTLRSVVVNLPPEKHGKLSIAKPLPDNVTADTITWNNVTSDSIYAVFGETQHYSLLLSYHLSNPNVYRVYTDITLPPDTLYQQIIYDSLLPKPDALFSDSDGNSMARYTLNPQEKKDIVFKGSAKVYAFPRTDYQAYISEQFSNQKYSLFDQQPLWTLSQKLVQSDNPKIIYDFVTKTLTYNFDRVIKGNSRMGASQAITFPDQAVCTEYSDLFISIGRQNGLFTREIQGYGFASDLELRPIQDDSDILHSWVEYYDSSKNRWVPIDPTWEDTSHIDYFSSFDLNHIVFAIHGKKSDYPYPAGSYKSDTNSKDVHVAPTKDASPIRKHLSAKFNNVPLPGDVKGHFILKFSIKNDGNVTIWNKQIDIAVKNSVSQSKSITIDHLIPGEAKNFSIEFEPRSAILYTSTRVEAKLDEELIGESSITVPTFLGSLSHIKLPAVLLLSGLTILLLFIKYKNDSKS